MKFNDIHINERDILGVDPQAFESADLVDEQGRTRFLFNRYPQLRQAHSGPAPYEWKRLLVHVADASDNATFRRVLVALSLKPSAVPF